MIRRAQWGALPAKSPTKFSRQVTGFVVHHTTGQHLGRNDSAAWVRSIQKYHQGKGWSDIGYHFVVDQKGQMFEGRGWDVVGAHAGGHNSYTVGVAFLGDGSGTIPDAALAAIRKLYQDACVHHGFRLDVYGHRDLGATSCPGDGLYSRLSEVTVSGMPLVVDKVSAPLQTVQAWAREKGANTTFIFEILPAIYEASAQQAFLNGGRFVDPVIVAAQSAKETGFGRFGGVLTAEWRNTAGIKTASGGGNFDPDAHERFGTWAEGARAQVNHLAAYVGLSPIGTPHGRYWIVKGLPWAGTVSTVEELGGRWAPSSTYGQDIVRMVDEARNQTFELPAVVTPSDPTLSLSDSGPEVRLVQSWLLLDGHFDTRLYTSVKRFQHKHGLKVDGIVGPKTWAKLREVYG